MSGAVALEPSSPTAASPRLSVALADMPHRTGFWMVIGQVVAGMETADAISLRPLRGAGTHQVKEYSPQHPVVIKAAEVVANEPDAQADLLPGGERRGP